jgi:hypothetical protein
LRLKIGKALGVGTGTVQRVLMEQPRPFDVGVAEAAFASQQNRDGRAGPGNPLGSLGSFCLSDSDYLLAAE